jgi:hypothetical protein
VVIEHRQVVDPVGGHPDQIAHRQRAVPTGARRCRHRNRRVIDRVGGLVELGQRGARDHRHRMPPMRPQPTGGDAGLQTEFEAVVAALRATAVIGCLLDGAVG